MPASILLRVASKIWRRRSTRLRRSISNLISRAARLVWLVRVSSLATQSLVATRRPKLRALAMAAGVRMLRLRMPRRAVFVLQHQRMAATVRLSFLPPRALAPLL